MNTKEYKLLKEQYVNLIKDSVGDCHYKLAITLTYKKYSYVTSEVNEQKNSDNMDYSNEKTNTSNSKNICGYIGKKLKNIKRHINSVIRDAKHFRNLLDNKLFGKFRGKIKRRAFGGLVIDGDDANYHIHGLLGFDDMHSLNHYIDAIRMAWAKIKQAGYIDDIREVDDVTAWAKYILKDRGKTVCFYDSLLIETIWNKQKQKRYEEELNNLQIIKHQYESHTSYQKIKYIRKLV